MSTKNLEIIGEMFFSQKINRISQRKYDYLRIKDMVTRKLLKKITLHLII